MTSSFAVLTPVAAVYDRRQINAIWRTIDTLACTRLNLSQPLLIIYKETANCLFSAGDCCSRLTSSIEHDSRAAVVDFSVHVARP